MVVESAATQDENSRLPRRRPEPGTSLSEKMACASEVAGSRVCRGREMLRSSSPKTQWSRYSLGVWVSGRPTMQGPLNPAFWWEDSCWQTPHAVGVSWGCFE